MINSIRNKRDIPNMEGFKAFGVCKDGTVTPIVVIKNKLGLHTIEGYNNLIGWLSNSDLTNRGINIE